MNGKVNLVVYCDGCKTKLVKEVAKEEAKDVAQLAHHCDSCGSGLEKNLAERGAVTDHTALVDFMLEKLNEATKELVDSGRVIESFLNDKFVMGVIDKDHGDTQLMELTVMDGPGAEKVEPALKGIRSVCKTLLALQKLALNNS